MIWDFFERRVCLTVQDHEWQKAVFEFERVGLPSVLRFNALPDIGPHQSFSKSERQILTDFYESGAKTLLHLEDDCIFKDFSHLPLALAELPDEWDILYLGANIQCSPQRVSSHLFRVTDCWTTHCIAYNRKVVPFLLENQPGFSEMMYDNFLGQQLGALNAFVIAPMIAWQRPRYSMIWGKETDYDGVFRASEEKLR